MHRCVECGHWGRPDMFGVDANTPSGLTARCFECINAEGAPIESEPSVAAPLVQVTVTVSPALADLRGLLASRVLEQGTHAERQVAYGEFEKLMKQARTEASS